MKFKDNKNLRIGTYSIILTLIVTAIVIVVNLFIGKLPSSATRFDTSSSGLYTLSDETKEFISGINDDITVYFVVESGSEDTTIEELLSKYTALNSHIKVVKMDPVLRPAFVSNYTKETLAENSLIIQSAKRYKVVKNSDIYVTEYSDDEIIAYYTNGTEPTGTTKFAGENAISGGLDYVTTDVLPTMYLLSGHGESSFSTTMAAYVNTENIATADLRLLTAGKIPSDANCVLINQPTSDISSAEYDILHSYAVNGGNIILITNYASFSISKMPNLDKLTEYFGAKGEEGLLVESDSSKYTQNKFWLLPTLGVSPISSDLVASKAYTLMAGAHGITATGSGIGTLYPLMTTSTGAYIKKDISSTDVTKKDGDPTGQYYVGVYVTDGNSQFVWFASSSIIDETADLYVSGGNSALFASAITTLCEKSTSISIMSKDTGGSLLTISSISGNFWCIVLIFVIPALVMAAGIVVFARRRKK